MRIDIVTVFPEMIREAIGHSIVKRAMERGLVTINVVSLRDFTDDRHRTTDDTPYGGGGGMVMKIEPIARALKALTAPSPCEALAAEAEPLPERNGDEATRNEADPQGRGSDFVDCRIVLTDPRGERFDQVKAQLWARESHLILVCGHYEGVDDRVRQHLVTDEVSIGDYILTGGELPALVIVDALVRLQAGALGDAEAPDKDTFAEDLLEYPHYTRPAEFNGWRVPDILLCGHHAEIVRWRRWHQLRETRNRRPDMYQRVRLAPGDEKLTSGPEPTAPIDKRTKRRKSIQTEKHEDTNGTGI